MAYATEVSITEIKLLSDDEVSIYLLDGRCVVVRNSGIIELWSPVTLTKTVDLNKEGA